MAAEPIQRFQSLLLEYSQQTNPDERKRIESVLWQEFGSEQAVMVLDMSGFSLLSRKFGIVHYLSMVRRMQLTAGPLIRSNGGRVVKFEADNCFAAFPEPLPAVRTAISLQFAFDAANLLTPNELDIRIAIGIDYGRVLLLGTQDYFGDAVNRASKLGEDVGAAGEILVTDEAMQRIPLEAGIRSRPVELSVSGLTVRAHVIEYRTEG